MLNTRDIPDVEILSVGTWHGTGCPPAGCSFTEDDLDEIAATYAATKDLLSPPLKLGHDDNQKLLQADGYPAAGWLSNVRRVGQKLLADLLKVPATIADLMDAGAYRNRSVELDANYEIGGKQYDIALTGMALLGADLPAVENLADITAWYKRQRLTIAPAARVVLFSAPAKTATFALPEGMSYDDLSSALRTAFIEASPGADRDSVWVSDLYEDAAIFSLEGRYWRQAYTVANGAVTLSGFPSEVQRVTQWEAVNARRMTYVDNAEHVLTDVQAFIARSAELASLRAKDGRDLSERHRERLASLRDGLREAQAKLDAFLEDDDPPEEQDYTRVMRARLRIAELRHAELIGA